MANSVLNGCGSYSQKLTEISTSVKKRKLMNGEPLTNQDIWDIDDNIFQAYQIILSQTRDSIGISKAIEYLEKEVETSGSSADFKELANVASQKAIKEVGNKNVTSNRGEKSDITGKAVIGAAIIDGIMINKELVESKLGEIQDGSIEAASAMVAYERSTAAFERIRNKKENGKITEKDKRQGLAWMMREVATGAIVDESHIIKMAEEMGFDIIKEDADGKKSIDENKLERKYQESLPENSKTTMRTIDDFRKLNEKVGKEAIEKGTYEGKDTNKIENRIIKMTRSPIEFRLEELIEEYNKMQGKGVSGEKLLKMQDKIEIVSEVVKESKDLINKENSLKKDEISNNGKKETSNLSEHDSDDEPSL